MKFYKILGKCEPKLIMEAERKLTAVFTELAMGYETKIWGSKLGGDIFLHQLVAPANHICDARGIELEETSNKILQTDLTPEGEPISLEEKYLLIQILKDRLGKQIVYTAATNGKNFFWSPQFIADKSLIGIRLTVGHEGTHAMYMHPSRRGTRIPMLWNIAVDFKTNFNLIEDLKLRKIHNAEEIFIKELGEFITLKEYADFIKDPFNPPAKLSHCNPIASIKNLLNSNNNNYVERKFYYAEPNLPDNLKKPENIYDFLLSQVPKCNSCGKIGVWKKPKEYKELEQQLKEQNKLYKNEHIC